MIIYFNKNTGELYGAIMGRTHNEFELENNTMEFTDIDSNLVEKKIYSVKETLEIEKKLIKNKSKIMEYEIDLQTKKLKKAKPREEIQQEVKETLNIDLTQNIEDIEKDYSKTTKQLIKSIPKDSLIFREISFSEIQKIRDVIEQLEDIKDIQLSKQILNQRANFLDGIFRAYIVENNTQEVLSVAIITVKGDKFSYTLGGTTLKGRDTHSNYFLVYNLIRDAKELGFTIYDFGGIYTRFANKEKQKINIFKEKWGGEKIRLV